MIKLYDINNTSHSINQLLHCIGYYSRVFVLILFDEALAESK